MQINQHVKIQVQKLFLKRTIFVYLFLSVYFCLSSFVEQGQSQQLLQRMGVKTKMTGAYNTEFNSHSLVLYAFLRKAPGVPLVAQQ